MAGDIVFGGLATGLDTGAIIQQLMGLERRPISALQTKQRTYNTQASKLRSLKTKLTTLKEKADALGGRGDVLTTKVSSSDEKVFTATSFGGAPLGPTSLHVTSLAMAEKTYSNTFAAKDVEGAAGTGTLSIQVGTDASVDVTIEATDTLETIVSKINSSDADVSAGMVFDGTDYRIRVTGNDTGLDRAISFTETGVALGFSNPANELQPAADAVFTLDNIPMTRSSNTFSDAIDGVKITLTGESPTAAASTLDVSRDDDSLRTKVEAFISAYNDIQTTINGEFAYTGTPKGATSLSGDSTLRSVQSKLRSRVGDAVTGTTGAYRTLASLGITSQNDGTLTLDSAKLEAAIAADSDAVADFFAGDTGASITGFAELLGADIDIYNDDTDGALTNRIDSLEGRSKDIDDQIDRLELRLDKTEERLTKQYANLEQIVSGLQNQGNQILAVLAGL